MLPVGLLCSSVSCGVDDGSGAPWWSEGSTRCQEEGGAIWSFLSASYSGELVLPEMAVPPIISLADPVCLCLFRDARTSCLESALQRWEFQLCGVSSASFWILQWPTSFHCSPAQGWQLLLAVAISCSVFAFSVTRLTIPWVIFSLLSI